MFVPSKFSITLEAGKESLRVGFAITDEKESNWATLLVPSGPSVDVQGNYGGQVNIRPYSTVWFRLPSN